MNKCKLVVPGLAAVSDTPANICVRKTGEKFVNKEEELVALVKNKVTGKPVLVIRKDVAEKYGVIVDVSNLSDEELDGGCNDGYRYRVTLYYGVDQNGNPRGRDRSVHYFETWDECVPLVIRLVQDNYYVVITNLESGKKMQINADDERVKHCNGNFPYNPLYLESDKYVEEMYGKWPEGSRFFVICCDFEDTIKDAIATGHIGAIGYSNTGNVFCICTDGCVPTVEEVMRFAPEKFGDSKIRIWRIKEIDKRDAIEVYSMVYTEDQKIFTNNVPPDYPYGVFLQTDALGVILVESGLSEEEAGLLSRKLYAPSGVPFVMNERPCHELAEGLWYTLYHVSEKEGDKEMESGEIQTVLRHLKDYPLKNDDTYREVVWTVV